MSEQNISNDPYLNKNRERLVQADGQNMYTPKAGFFDQLGVGFGKGQDFTSFALLSDLGMKWGLGSPQENIPLEDWNEQHPYYAEDVEWSDDLTIDIARNIFVTRAESQNYQSFVERGGGGGMLTRGLGLFGGAALDPINLVAAPAAVYAKAGLLGRMALAGGANFVVESALQTVAYNTQDVRGEKLGAGDVAANLGFAVVIGGAFPLAGKGLSKLFNASRSGKRTTGTDFETANYTQSQKQTANVYSDHTNTQRLNTIENTDFNTIDKINVNTKGRINDDGGVEVTRNADNNTITITGTAEELVKVLPTMSGRLTTFDSVTVTAKGDVPTTSVATTAEEIQALVKTFEDATGIKGELDAVDVRLETRTVDNKNYKIEFDENGQYTGRVFETTPKGKAKRKPMPEDKAQKIIEANEALNNTRKTTINQNAGKTTTNRSSQVFDETVDSKLNTKKDHATKGEVEASVSGQSKAFQDNHGNTAVTNTVDEAIGVTGATHSLAQTKTVTGADWFRAGYFLNRQGELVDLTKKRVADLTSDERMLLGKRIGTRRTEIPVDENGFAKVEGNGIKLRKMVEEFDANSKALDNENKALIEHFFCRIAG